MSNDKFDINYKKINFNGKPIFLFINHKVSILCWAKIKNKEGMCEVITFDSHKDFRGFIVDSKNILGGSWGSRFIRNEYVPKHFSECNEFMNWDLLDEDQNKRILEEGKMFLTSNNDNFIGVALMKNIIKDVFWYYFQTENDTREAECDDINGVNHNYFPKKINEFCLPENRFILDIDLDFFVKNPALPDCSLLSLSRIKEYVNLINKIMNNPNCKGVTIALEPECCGGRENCLIILKELSNKIGIDLEKEIKNL